MNASRLTPNASRHTFSFELFPSNPEGLEKLRTTRKQLSQLKPSTFP
jgi:hypothetical protein